MAYADADGSERTEKAAVQVWPVSKSAVAAVPAGGVAAAVAAGASWRMTRSWNEHKSTKVLAPVSAVKPAKVYGKLAGRMMAALAEHRPLAVDSSEFGR